MRLGTWQTIDCPTDNIDEAYVWLQDKFDDIHGEVRKVYNDHDFGPYPSFEVDYPSEYEDIDEFEEVESYDEEKKQQEKIAWEEMAEKIYSEYYKKFEALL